MNACTTSYTIVPVPEHPWLIEVWEPLKTKAPCPDKTQPYCCYIKTVIFYVKPYTVRPWHHLYEWKGKLAVEKPGREFERWDKIETELTWDSIIEHGGQRFLCGGGTVVWKDKRWWMKRTARRERKD